MKRDVLLLRFHAPESDLTIVERNLLCITCSLAGMNGEKKVGEIVNHLL